ncbi:restriction endonuclease subunit S [Synechococcus sp. CS-1325]|uniref:restriction endonuclease subunit S n=1 Tax=Synechococcus sp. CS-1325 TaxID=2847979 RepID=UPI000DAFE30D|nr:restriction endonuclease subunit S [Synechococcus sp. CS-1325]MCT0199074.1 restriction endonuclease subunit S [Synechococcus sp. CS-1325]PZU99503.1 MAG: hypothetical protein DCF24_09125 [Cyanobium sp.]
MELKPGYKQTEVGVIPEEWEVVTATEACELVVDCKNRTPPVVPDSDYAVVRTPNVRNGQFVIEDLRFTDEASFREWTARAVPQFGDILITREAPLGEVCAVPEARNVCLGQRMMLYRPSPTKTETGYLLYSLMSVPVRVNLLRKIGGSTVGHAKVDDIRYLQLPLPPLPEQRAIATALSDVDALLGALDRLIAKKRDLKQAAMQQLLTGQTRLPGFHGEWEMKRLGELVHLIPSGIYGEEKPREGLQPVLVATTAHIDTDDTWNIKQMAVRFFPQDKVQRYSIQEGDLIVVKSSGSAASIQSGKLGFVDGTRAGKFLFSNFLMLLRPTSIVPLFLYFYLCSHNVKKLLPTLVEASTYPNIRLGDYLEVEIPKPPPDEQTAIASVLSEMDTELTGLEKRQAKTRALKQGMMQELLTGRTRMI